MTKTSNIKAILLNFTYRFLHLLSLTSHDYVLPTTLFTINRASELNNYALSHYYVMFTSSQFFVVLIRCWLEVT